MKYGKVISLYLINGNTDGVVCAYLSNWTGQAIKFSRSLISEVKKREEVNKPGVYFLFNRNEDTNEIEIYIGESENIYNRLIQHIKDEKKEFFNEVIAFTSKDEELTKSHIKYLEYRLVNEISENEGFLLKNINKNIRPIIPEMYISILEEYLQNIKVLLPTLGYDLFIDKDELREAKERKFIIEADGIKAEAILTKNNKMVVLKGSNLKNNIQSSLSNGYKNLRERLIKTNVIDSQNLIFLKDCEFNSPSAAAAIILGIAVNGRRKWISKGKTLEEIQRLDDEKILKETNGGN